MDKTTRRTALTAADLFVLLDREFRRRQPRDCASCYVPLPFRVDASHAEHPNWEIVLSRCARNCDAVLQDLVHEYQQRYELSVAR